MKLSSLPFSTPWRRNQTSAGPPDPFDDYRIGYDARDLSNNGDGNAGWSNGDSPSAATPVVAGGSLGGAFLRDAAPGLVVALDAGDGVPSLQNSSTDDNALMRSSLAAADFGFLGPDGTPFSISHIVRRTVDATDGLGTLHAIGPLDVFGGSGGYLVHPTNGGFSGGLYAERLPDPAGSNFVIDFAPPENEFYVVTWEHPGQFPGELQRLFVNGVEVSSLAVEATYSAGPPGSPLFIGNTNELIYGPFRGDFRWMRAWDSIGWAADVYAYAVANGLVPSESD